MKVVFLDFDGVLLPVDGPRDGRPVLGSAVLALNILCDVSGADVVVSSNWRVGRSVEELARLLSGWGFLGHVVGKTGDHDDEDRGAEILAWVRANGVDRFVALDDDPTDLTKLGTKLVSVDPEKGLTLPNAARAISILGPRTRVAKVGKEN